MPGLFELKASENGQFTFVLKADNGEIILRSESYSSKAAAEKGIASVQSHAANPVNYSKHEAKDGSFYFNLLAANGLIVGTSQMYKSEAARDKGLASVQTNGPSTTVVSAS